MVSSRRATTSWPRASTSAATGVGPVWINTNWLLWNGLRQHGQHAEADEILLSSLRLVDRSGFHEYFDPFGGEAFGTDGFGWTAALTLDFIERHRGAERTRLLERLEAAAAAGPPEVS